MHEFSLVQSLLKIVEEKVREEGGEAATRIRIRVGAFSGAEPDLLESAFEFLKEGSLAKGAELVIVKERAKVRCRRCGNVFSPSELDLTCPRCSSWGGEILEGESLYLESIEIELR